MFEPDEIYSGSAYLDGNTLIVPKSECSSYAGRFIGEFDHDFVGTYGYNYVQVVVNTGAGNLTDSGWIDPDTASKAGIQPGTT